MKHAPQHPCPDCAGALLRLPRNAGRGIFSPPTVITHGGAYPRGEYSRVRLSVSHPMDNGLVGGIPEFYLDQAELRAADGSVLGRLELFPAVSENPSLTFEVRGDEPTRQWLRDNSGNEFEADF